MGQGQEVVIVGTDGKEHVFPAGFDPKRAAEIVRQQTGETSAPAATAPPPVAGRGSSFDPTANGRAAVVGLAKGLTKAVPAAGGILGGLAAGTPGAIVGGFAGEGYRQLAEHATEIPGAIKDVASNLLAHPVATAEGAVQGTNQGAVTAAAEGGAQGAGQLVGEGLAKSGSVMSKWLMNRATSRVSAKLMQEFPELSDILIDNSLTVSKGGYARAKSLLLAAKSKATAALKVADSSGSTVPVQLDADLGESLKTGLLEKAVKAGQLPGVPKGAPVSPTTQRLTPDLETMFKNIDQAVENGTPLDLKPSQADIFKTQLQKESRALYANRNAPNGPRAMQMDATGRAEYAMQLNTAIDDLATGYKAANAEAKPLIGATRGIKQAIRPNGNLLQAMVRPAVGGMLGGAAGAREGGTPGGVAGAVAGAALTSPAGMSREAILLAHPVMQGVLRALPKPLAQGLMELLSRELAGSPAPGPTR